MKTRGIVRWPAFVLLAVVWLAIPASVGRADVDVYGALTDQIQRQIRLDKVAFLTAQVCTEWFYKERHRQRDAPTAETVAFSHRMTSPDPLSDPTACVHRYPTGLEAARRDASKTQSTLSLSLTFYEFALVADRDDDDRYSPVELRDMVESCGLTFNEVLPLSAHLTVLQRQFEWVQERGGLEAVMTGMGLLYDRGYRLSSHDRAAIAKISE